MFFASSISFAVLNTTRNSAENPTILIDPCSRCSSLDRPRVPLYLVYNFHIVYNVGFSAPFLDEYDLKITDFRSNKLSQFFRNNFDGFLFRNNFDGFSSVSLDALSRGLDH